MSAVRELISTYKKKKKGRKKRRLGMNGRTHSSNARKRGKQKHHICVCVRACVRACVPVLTSGHDESLNDQAANILMRISFSRTAVMGSLTLLTVPLIAHQYISEDRFMCACERH